ncbi:hypothetical protein E0Z10_g8900 [Xylaria hypoxylon]|uniref:ER-bound oxygenase mpaB/mpaB'/Rubber oxygenase catalytic domain-containing protein n=1 Tax=Xylaria hypoxylon TaxID=37992 RepID=A0A4Z0YIK5_9PEZI|nr:hypothetical protein E0Z10_g8900 [Xylaria hypoxylon]
MSANMNPDALNSLPLVENEMPLSRAVSKEYFLSPNFTPKYMNRIIQEGILLIAGAAAILLQIAEPGVGAGVNEHSNFAYRVLDRLRTTMTFVYAITYGTPEEKKTMVGMITQVHSRVSGTLNEGQDKGKPYSALDPALQLWVAATLYATAISLYERIWGMITDEQEHDNIYFEYSILACSLQVPVDMWPPSRQAFWDYFNHKIATLEVTQHARDVCEEIMYLRHAPLYLRIFMPGVRVCTSAFLPERIRWEYGLSSHPKMYKLLEWLIKGLYRPLPIKVRGYPATFYMRDMRRRLASRQKIFEKA